MTQHARLTRLERSIPKPRCECEDQHKPCRVVHVGDREEEPSARRCPKCGRTERLIIVKYLVEGLWAEL